MFPGDHENTPDLKSAAGVNVAPGVAVMSAVSDVIGSPSGSLAVTVNVTGEPWLLRCVAGATTTGAWSSLVITSFVLATPASWFDAVNVTPNVPNMVVVGVQVN